MARFGANWMYDGVRCGVGGREGSSSGMAEVEMDGRSEWQSRRVEVGNAGRALSGEVTEAGRLLSALFSRVTQRKLGTAC